MDTRWYQSQESLATLDHEHHHQDVDKKDDPEEVEQEDESKYPPLLKVIFIMIGLNLGTFLVALDRTIIGTAVPTITSEFHAGDEVGWFAGAYMLTMSGFLLTFGRIYAIYTPKWVFMVSMIIFEVGSVICGAAPNSIAFIVGRAIAGLGAGGIFNGVFIIIVDLVPLRKRPMWTGFNGAMFGIASVVGPLVGGAFTTNVSWRWCFYINLPVGGFTLLAVLFLLPATAPAHGSAKSIKEHILRLDPLGTMLYVPAIVCLLLALQWGGVTYNWANARIIALLILFGVLLIAFGIAERFNPKHATIPGNVVKNRSIAFGFFFTFCVGGVLLVADYYMPIYFQAVKGANAVNSGIRTLPLILSLVVGALSAGGLVTLVGYYVPFMFVSAAIMAVGSGLISTLEPDTTSGKWIGFQILVGFGVGVGLQQTSVAAQTVLTRHDVSSGIAIIESGQSLGGAVFTSVAQSVLSNRLQAGLAGLHIPDFDAKAVATEGLTDLKSLVAPEYLEVVTQAYNDAITQVFYVSVALAGLAFLFAFGMEWKNVKDNNNAGAKNDNAIGSDNRPDSRGNDTEKDSDVKDIESQK